MIEVEFRGGPADGEVRAVAVDDDGWPPRSVRALQRMPQPITTDTAAPMAYYETVWYQSVNADGRWFYATDAWIESQPGWWWTS